MKSKLNFFLSALLVLLFIMGLSTCSYASSIDTEEMIVEDADYLFNYSMTTSITTSLNLPTCYYFSPKCVEISYSEAGTQVTQKSQVNSAFNNDTAKTNFLIAFNRANASYNSNLSIKNYMFIFYTSDDYSSSWIGSSYLYVLCIPVNNTSSDTLPYPVVYYNRFPDSNYGIGQMTLDFLTNNDDLTMRTLTISERDNLSIKPFLITINRDFSCTYSKDNWYSRKMRIITNKSYRAILYNYNSSDTLKYSPLNIIFPIDQASNVLYAPTNLSSTSSISSFNNSTFSPYLIKSWGRIIETQEPEQPEDPDNPDVPGGSGNTGTITNPSGDTTGKVDLSGIEQGIGAVKDAVNNVTNTIKDAFTFNSGDAKEVMEDFENTDLGLSQDLYDLNNQFFELFEKEEMDDFKISWNGVNYQEAQLIPSGEVNFSAMCRENEQLGKIKDYITLFAIVGASLTLLKVIWNMIAEMLGLNQTLMETDFGDAVMYTYEDNSYDIDTRAYLDSKRYNKRR